MTAPAIVALPTRDELVTTALDRLYWLEKQLDKPLTPSRLHVIRGHATAIRAALLTPPLRPNGIEVEE